MWHHDPPLDHPDHSQMCNPSVHRESLGKKPGPSYVSPPSQSAMLLQRHCGDPKYHFLNSQYLSKLGKKVLLSLN